MTRDGYDPRPEPSIQRPPVGFWRRAAEKYTITSYHDGGRDELFFARGWMRALRVAHALERRYLADEDGHGFEVVIYDKRNEMLWFRTTEP